MKKRKIAIMTGISLIVMAIVAVFVIGYAYAEFDTPGEIEFVNNILQNKGLYLSMLYGFLVIILLDFIVSYNLYKYFEDDHKKMSAISGLIRTIYTIIFIIAVYHLTKNINSNELTNQLAKSNFDQFQTIWNVGLVVFGFHIILIGYLMKLHLKIPKILWYITLIAGVSYIVVSLLKLTIPNSEIVSLFVILMALPMTIGEMGLAVWLLIKGGKNEKDNF